MINQITKLKIERDKLLRERDNTREVLAQYRTQIHDMRASDTLRLEELRKLNKALMRRNRRIKNFKTMAYKWKKRARMLASENWLNQWIEEDSADATDTLV